MEQPGSPISLIKRFIHLRLKGGFGQFLIGAVILIAILGIENNFFPRHEVLVQLNVIGRTSAVLILFVGLIFFAMERYRLYDLKKQPFAWKSFAIFFPVHLAFYWGFFTFKNFLISNPDLIGQHFYWWVCLRYILPLSMVAFLGISLLGIKFVKKFLRSLIIALILAFSIFHLSFLFKQYWKFFSTIVTTATHFLLKLSFPDTFMDLAASIAPRLESAGFGVNIEYPCSGIESLSLFTLLYLLVTAIDRKVINKKRAIFAFFFGFLGMFSINILRIYFLFLSGIYINPRFAMHQFHTNIGWVLFLVYFAIFWLSSYNWLRRGKTINN